MAEFAKVEIYLGGLVKFSFQKELQKSNKDYIKRVYNNKSVVNQTIDELAVLTRMENMSVKQALKSANSAKMMYARSQSFDQKSHLDTSYWIGWNPETYKGMNEDFIKNQKLID